MKIVGKSYATFGIVLGGILVLALIARRSDFNGRDLVRTTVKESHGNLNFPQDIKRVHIDIGPNFDPMQPPENGTAILAVEPNVGIANFLRETYQKQKFSSNFFVLNVAVSSTKMSGRLATFRSYNAQGKWSSLSPAITVNGQVPHWASKEYHDLNDPSSAGPMRQDFVSVIDLETLLCAIPEHIDVEFLKTDTQGHDLEAIKSSSMKTLRRVKKIMAETFIGDFGEKTYPGVNNDLKDWIPYMKRMGYTLINKYVNESNYWDGIWERHN